MAARETAWSKELAWRDAWYAMSDDQPAPAKPAVEQWVVSLVDLVDDPKDGRGS
jgi:hypothetical protein